jgi:hypothetical protein
MKFRRFLVDKLPVDEYSIARVGVRDGLFASSEVEDEADRAGFGSVCLGKRKERS